jgi:hypothetical protein
MRVAAYGRVSASIGPAIREKSALIQRYADIISNQPEWSFAGIYIDSGSSHEQFNALMERCGEGAVDTVLTASLTTFALRREGLFKSLQQLRDNGVTVNFIDENLTTADESGDALLSTLSSFLKPSKPPKPATVPYGFGDDEEAAVVQRIFSLFLSGHGRTTIATILNDDHVPSPKAGLPPEQRGLSKADWTYCDIRRILSDPIYVKEGIIDEETWERTNAEQSLRTQNYGRRPPANSPLFGVITCGICGNQFSRRERGKGSIWLCRTYLKKGHAVCPSRCIREDCLQIILSEAVGIKESVGMKESVDTTESVDNITVWPDGQLVINTGNREIRRRWGRKE